MNFANCTNQLGRTLAENSKQLKEFDEEFKASFEKLKLMRKNSMNNHSKARTTSQGIKLKSIENEYKNCRDLCEKRMDFSNESYFLLDNEIKKVNQIIEKLEQEMDNFKYKTFSFQNYLLDKHCDQLVSFDNFINSKKKSKNKKTRNTLKNLNHNFNLSINSLKKRKCYNDMMMIIAKLGEKIVKGKIGKRGRIPKEILLKNRADTEGNVKGKEEIKEANLEDITYKEIDGKIGPKEQIYCFCNYVSYGNMIKCDNPKCEREWFHFHCVGLKNMPLGKWFCSTKCADTYKKKN